MDTRMNLNIDKDLQGMGVGVKGLPDSWPSPSALKS